MGRGHEGLRIGKGNLPSIHPCSHPSPQSCSPQSRQLTVPRSHSKCHAHSQSGPVLLPDEDIGVLELSPLSARKPPAPYDAHPIHVPPITPTQIMLRSPSVPRPIWNLNRPSQTKGGPAAPRAPPGWLLLPPGTEKLWTWKKMKPPTAPSLLSLSPRKARRQVRQGAREK
jgi:hypothetical protein